MEQLILDKGNKTMAVWTGALYKDGNIVMLNVSKSLDATVKEVQQYIDDVELKDVLVEAHGINTVIYGFSTHNYQVAIQGQYL